MNSRNTSGRDRSSGRGWFGDERGHSEASREGWQHRRGGRSRDYDDDDDYQRSSGSRSGNSGRGEGRGWYGDEEEHSRAARKGWRNRD